MTQAIINASPRSILTGIKDESTVALEYTPEELPQHLPLFFIQSPTGPITPQLVTGAELLEMYGTGTVDQNSEYYSHQTHGMLRANAEGNVFFAKRLVDTSARAASAVIYAEYIKDTALPWARDANGAVIVDGTGTKTTEGTDEVEIYKLLLTVEAIPTGKTIHDVDSEVGTVLTSSIAGEVSAKVPLMAIEHSFHGNFGNNTGFNLWFPHERTSEVGDIYAMNSAEANLYRMRFLQRASVNRSPGVIETQLGEQTIDVPIGGNVLNDKTSLLYTDDSIIEQYSIDTPGFVPRFGPIGDFNVYGANMLVLQTLLATAENTLAGTSLAPAEFNVFNALNIAGYDNASTRFNANSASFDSSTTHYLFGGNDGAVNEATLDTLTQDFINNDFDSTDAPLTDIAKYPFSSIYDTGFTMDTKHTLLTVLGKRADVNVTVCTQDLSIPDNNTSAELAAATSLYNAARLIPESVRFGTPTVRATIMGQMGTDINHLTKRRFPLVMDLISKRSAYMGAGNGFFKPADAYDVGQSRNVTGITKVTQPWKPEAAYFADWDVGLNTVRHIDRTTLYHPGIQTVYSNDTSVINSDINMLIACDVIRKQHRVWQALTANGKLTSTELLAESTRIMEEYVFGKYDERVTFEINSYKTPADTARGYSWTMNAIMYMNNMPTVATMQVTVRRAA